MESLRSRREGNAVGTEAHSSSHRLKLDRTMRFFEGSYPSIQLHKKEFEEEFNKLNHTPDHPPYAHMIHRAITKLNEQEGSSEETISKFIEAEYEDLPIAHTSLLTRHLQKLAAKVEIVCTSRNCYVLSFENSDLLHKLKKEQKHLRSFGHGRKKCRQHKVKGVKSQKKQTVEESQELTQMNGKIFESTGDQTEQGHAELIEEQNRVEELRVKAIEEQVEAEQDNDWNEEHDQMQEQQNKQQKELYSQQNLVPRQTTGVLVGEKNQVEESNLAENHNEVTEAEHQKELEKVIEEQDSEKLEEKNQINNQESEAREEQVQLPEVHNEAMVGQTDPQAKHFEVIEEEKRLKEQQTEVCCQIMDLSNTLMRFIKKEKENKATMSGQNMDLFVASCLTKEEFMELLKKTNKIQWRLIDTISYFKKEMSDKNNADTAIRRQQELLEEHLQQELLEGQPQLEQQLEVFGQLKKVPEYQPKTTPPSENDVPADSMQLERNIQNDEHPSHGRQAEDKTTTLDELLAKQSKQIKLRDQQEATKSQPMSTLVSFDGPCDSAHDKNENKRMVIQGREQVLEDNSQTAQEKIKFSRDATMSKPVTEKSYLVQFIDEQLQNTGHSGPERVPKSPLVTSSLNVLQEPILEHQQQTNYKYETEGPEYKQQPEIPTDGSHVEPEQRVVEHQIQSEVAADTCVAKQSEKPKELQYQRQRRKLQPRVPSPSEGDHNVTLALLKSEIKQKLQPSSLKRPREASPKTVVETSNSRGQQKKQQCQHKWLKCHPIVDSAITSQQQVRQLRPRGEGPSRCEMISLQLQQQEQEQPKPEGRGRPKLKSNDTAMKEMLDLHHRHHEQQQPQQRGRGRPPKQKTNADASLKGSLPLDHHNHNEKQPSHRGCGRPPKSKLAAASE